MSGINVTWKITCIDNGDAQDLYEYLSDIDGYHNVDYKYDTVIVMIDTVYYTKIFRDLEKFSNNILRITLYNVEFCTNA